MTLRLPYGRGQNVHNKQNLRRITTFVVIGTGKSGTFREEREEAGEDPF